MSAKKFVLLVFYICVIFTNKVNSQAVEEGGDCFTPNDRYGICVDIRACNDLIRILQTRSNDPKAVDFLRRSTCGYIGQIPLVCCERTVQPRNTTTTSTTTPTTTTTTTTTTTSRPSIKTTEDYDYNEEISSRYSLPRYPNCGISHESNEKIVGGRNARLGEFPWIVALGYKNSKNANLPKWLCGGSLITDKHVLTAGHCVSKRNDLYLVRAGDLDLYDEEEGAKPINVRIEKVILHENYNPTSVSNDIALIRLERPVSGYLISPVCLPLDEPMKSRDFVNYIPIVAGWGAIYFNGPSSPILQAVMLPVVRNSDCKQAFSQFRNVRIDERVLCAGYLRGSKDSCQGDSGGPMVLQQGRNDQNVFYQIGVVSYGFRCAAEGYPGVYTRVTAFMDWIEKNLES